MDTSILRVCWKTYIEALPVLYGNNSFMFHSPKTINCFRAENLALVHPSHNERQILPVFFAQPNPHGRFSLIRIMALDLTCRYDHSLGSFDEYAPTAAYRSRATESWAPFLFTDIERDGNEFMAFPNLEHLELGFTDWMLKEEERLDVSLTLKRYLYNTMTEMSKSINLNSLGLLTNTVLGAPLYPQVSGTSRAQVVSRRWSEKSSDLAEF